MKRAYLFIFALIIILFSSLLQAEEPQTIVLASAPINESDMNSIKRGAKFFANTCLACHTLVYLRNDPLVQEAGITYEKMPVNIKSWPYGVAPPDLSSEADIRGVNWLYTYLHSFYEDPSRPTGVNNLLVPNTAMPAILSTYQGTQSLVKGKIKNGILYNDLEWYDLLRLNKQGMMTPEEFDQTTADVVNFLAYIAAPYKQEQHRIGWWALGFLLVFFFMIYFLKKEYWKDVKDYRNS